MATNAQVEPVSTVYIAVPSGTVSGSPVMVGALAGVAQFDRDSAGKSTVSIAPGVYTVSVKGIDDSGNSAVALGDAIFFTSGDTPVLSKKSSGSGWGIALDAVTSGSTASIPVLLCVTPFA